ncbi:ECF transporter S component [Heyndrickxia oleronia]|uniref:ECF transporter S component n=2 Tax=Heyndrickxia oleronia TaxID=38875 RepID=A0A8E2LDA8_9BACI|nr:ECF transporter S component [Heyndrickxia oleronia]NYV66686.1 ECF transporter S component [Bacillus sp. Gen3]OJH17171.1 ECF transporter S component [Bacillus obstructivus]MBU5211941.1 ECF transporter S component [Heyndrickxia oleronia]MCM3456842.1 ECF transporter S component [Heyndrickxia oleronia]MEC1376834.1 ECF transporter S component [Heyndrickxia oleronia]
MKRGIRYDFSLLALLLIPVGVSLNVVGYQLSTILKLPVFVDQIGTIMVSMIAGPWIGLLTGLLGNVVNGMLNPIAIGFSIVSMSIGFVSGYLSKWKFYNNIFGIILSCILLTIVSAFTAAIVTVFMFGGVTGAGTDLITATFLATGKELWNSVVSTNLISGSINTILNFGISWLIIRRVPDRFLIKLNYGEPYIKKGGNVNG